jgi:hypothetical protein
MTTPKDEKGAEPARDWKHIEGLIDEAVDGYIMEGDSGCYTPTEHEQALIKDCIMGLTADREFLAAVATPSGELDREALLQRWLDYATKAAGMTEAIVRDDALFKAFMDDLDARKEGLIADTTATLANTAKRAALASLKGTETP